MWSADPGGRENWMKTVKQHGEMFIISFAKYKWSACYDISHVKICHAIQRGREGRKWNLLFGSNFKWFIFLKRIPSYWKQPRCSRVGSLLCKCCVLMMEYYAAIKNGCCGSVLTEMERYSWHMSSEKACYTAVCAVWSHLNTGTPRFIAFGLLCFADVTFFTNSRFVATVPFFQ